MKGHLRIALLLALSLLLMLCSAESSPDADSRKLDAFFNNLIRKNRIPGLAVAITQRDRVIYLRGFGTAGDGRLMTPQTPLYVGSLSKSITALAVMQLAEAGKIRLDSPVRDYLPWFQLSD